MPFVITKASTQLKIYLQNQDTRLSPRPENKVPTVLDQDSNGFPNNLKESGVLLLFIQGLRNSEKIID